MSDHERAVNEQAPRVSLEELRDRLMRLQPELEAVLDKADVLFDDFFDLAPHPSEVEKGFPVYATSTANRCPATGSPMGRELTVVIVPRQWLRIFRTTDSAPDAYPRRALWHWRPMGALNRKTDIKYIHSPARSGYPFDLEVIDYDSGGMCQKIINTDYIDVEKFINRADEALDNARKVAEALL